jgi:hypothetical protein
MLALMVTGIFFLPSLTFAIPRIQSKAVFIHLIGNILLFSKHLVLTKVQRYPEIGIAFI